MDQKKTSVFVVIVIVLVILVAGSVYLFNRKSSETETNTPNSEVLSDTDDEFVDYVNEKEITLSPGESGTFETMSVTFNKVTDDNRCPSSVQCIVAGRVVGEFALELGNEKKTVLISSDAHQPYSFHDYFVAIKEVRPAKVNPGTLDPNSYEVVLIVSRNVKL